MLGFISKLFGGSKSEKDIKSIEPIILQINKHFQSYQNISNDALRGKTILFRERIQDYIKPVNVEIKSLEAEAEALPLSDINGKDEIYQKIDSLKKRKTKNWKRF